MTIRSLLLVSAAVAVISTPAFAATKAQDETNAQLETLQRAVSDLNSQVQQQSIKYKTGSRLSSQ